MLYFEYLFTTKAVEGIARASLHSTGISCAPFLHQEAYSCLFSEACNPQGVLVFTAALVDFHDPLDRTTNPTASPIKWSDTDVACLSLPLTICKNQIKQSTMQDPCTKNKQIAVVVKVTARKQKNNEFQIYQVEYRNKVSYHPRAPRLNQ